MTQPAMTGEEAYLTLSEMEPLKNFTLTCLTHVPQASDPTHYHIISSRTPSPAIIEALLKNHISEDYQMTMDQMEVLSITI